MGNRLCSGAARLAEPKELADYQSLLKDELWRPTTLEIFVMNRDGSNLRQVTKLGGANFAPAWHPDGKRIIFASNIKDPKGRNFDIFLINLDGTGLEQVTFNSTFDGFPMFSPDGKRLVFASNRGAKSEGETNVFVADWVRVGFDTGAQEIRGLPKSEQLHLKYQLRIRRYHSASSASAVAEVGGYRQFPLPSHLHPRRPPRPIL